MTDGKVAEVLAEMAAWREGKLWGLPAIAQFAGVSVDTVRRWAALSDCPITQPGGRYFATRDELTAWMRQKNCA